MCGSPKISRSWGTGRSSGMRASRLSQSLQDAVNLGWKLAQVVNETA